MTKNTLWLRVDGQRAAQDLLEAARRLESCEGEAVMDFSALPRIDAQALGALEALAARAADRGVKVTLHGVNVSVYKVLKLMKLAPQFSFDA